MAYSKYLKVYTYTAELRSYLGSTLASYSEVRASHLGGLGLPFLLEVLVVCSVSLGEMAGKYFKRRHDHSS